MTITPISIGFIILGFIFLWLSLQQYNIKSVTKKMMPGNIWETEDGTIVKIVDISHPDDDYMLKCKSQGKDCEYNTSGNKNLDFTFTDDKKFSRYIGTKKTHPEYFL